MRIYKIIDGDYLVCIGKGNSGIEISESEYNTILSVIASKPATTATTDYWLKTDLTWEPYEIDPPDPDPEIDDAELLEILMGGAE